MNNKMTDGKIFNYLCIFTGLATIVVSLIQLIPGSAKFLGYMAIIALIAAGVLYVGYHIFCRRQYNMLNEKYILSGRISKFGANAYLNLHLSIFLGTPMCIAMIFWKGAPISYRLYFAAILAVIVGVKILIDKILTKKYGEEGFVEIQTAMMRVSQGKPFFMKGMLAAGLGALLLIFHVDRKNRF